MKRYHTLLAGASWMAEYGNPDTDDWEFLQKYSPYHSKLKWQFTREYGRLAQPDPIRVRAWLTLLYFVAISPDIDPTAEYPPLLVTTSTRDDRVHPGHARKFVKVRRCILTS